MSMASTLIRPKSMMTFMSLFGLLVGFGLGQIIPDEEFLRRALLQVAVAGNHLYLEAGETSRAVDGKFDNPTSRVVKNTYSIPLDQKWTNTTVQLKEVDMNGMLSPVKLFSLWTDGNQGAGSTRLYRWGGIAPQFETYPDAQNPRLGVFSPDGHGGGAWATQELLPRPRSIKRVAAATSTSCNGVGLSLGGWGNEWTDTTLRGGNYLTPGLVTYDMASNTWANESALPFSLFGTHIFSSAVCLPSLGSVSSTSGRVGGLAFFIGGEKGTVVIPDTGAGLQTDPVRLDNITFYDVAAKRWHWQTATGDVPQPRNRFCAVAVSAGSSYEIVVFGGASPTRSERDRGLGDVHVLTIPGFRWFKADGATAPRRQSHACAVVGRGGMMVSVGGWEDEFTNMSWVTRDVWDKGIGVLDLSALQWVDAHDPAAGPYERPRNVGDWYNNGGLASVNWDSNVTKQLFSVESAPRSDERQPDIGAIVGGVVGGLVFIGLVAVVVFFVVRRRRRQRERKRAEIPKESDDLNSSGEIPWRQTTYIEMEAPRQVCEVHGTRVDHELDAQDKPIELSGR